MPKNSSSPVAKTVNNRPVRIAEPTVNTYIDDAKIEVLCTALELGNTRATACAIASIRYDLFSRWMAKGGYPLTAAKVKDVVDPDEAEEPYYSFAMRVISAEANAEARAVNQLVSAGDRDWRASAHWLQHRRPADWATEKQSPSIQIGTASGVQIYLPDNGRGDTKEIIEGTILEGEIRELDK